MARMRRKGDVLCPGCTCPGKQSAGNGAPNAVVIVHVNLKHALCGQHARHVDPAGHRVTVIWHSKLPARIIRAVDVPSAFTSRTILCDFEVLTFLATQPEEPAMHASINRKYSHPVLSPSRHDYNASCSFQVEVTHAQHGADLKMCFVPRLRCPSLQACIDAGKAAYAYHLESP